MDMSLDNVQIKPFQQSFFSSEKEDHLPLQKRGFPGESSSLQTLISLLLWKKKPPQTEKFFLAKIMSRYREHFTSFYITTLVLSKPYPILSIPKRVNLDPLGFKVSTQDKSVLFQNWILCYQQYSRNEWQQYPHWAEDAGAQHKPNAMVRHESLKSNTLPIHISPHSACWMHLCMLVYNTEHILTWKHLTTLKTWKTSWFNLKYLLLYYVPSYHKKGHSVCLLIFTVRETKQIKLFCIGLAQGISKMTILKAHLHCSLPEPCVASSVSFHAFLSTRPEGR